MRTRCRAQPNSNRGSDTGWGTFYQVIHKDGVSLRSSDSVSAGLTGEKLHQGEIFKVKSKVKRSTQLGLELLRGRGWAFAGKASQPLVREVAPPLTDVTFPLGVTGLDWVPAEGPNKRFLSLEGVRKQEAQALLTEAGVGIGDCLVMINQKPIYDMHFTRLLERIEVWTGLPRSNVEYYQVVTEGQYGIGLREEPALEAPRTGEDLLREDFFVVDSIAEDEDGMRYLQLEDGRGWALDNRLVDPANPCVREIDEIKDGCTLTFWTGSPPDLFACLDPACFEAPTPPLPAGWERVMDPESGKVYYFNRATKETSWTMPTAA